MPALAGDSIGTCAMAYLCRLNDFPRPRACHERPLKTRHSHCLHYSPPSSSPQSLLSSPPCALLLQHLPRFSPACLAIGYLCAPLGHLERGWPYRSPNGAEILNDATLLTLAVQPHVLSLV